MKVWEYKSNEDDNLSKQVEKNKDIVMTNPVMARDLINRIEFEDGDVVMEPGRGTGSFYNNFPDNVQKVWCEINEGRDYFDFQGMVDYTVSNPPFVPRKLFWAFHVKAMETTRKKIYWVLNCSSINIFTPKRLDDMKDNGWFIQSLHIINDKRWFGRYLWIEIGKEDRNFFSWHRGTY